MISRTKLTPSRFIHFNCKHFSVGNEKSFESINLKSSFAKVVFSYIN